MARYRQKSMIVEAWQFTTETAGKEIFLMLINSGSNASFNTFATGSATLDVRIGNTVYTLEMGDWLLKYPEGASFIDPAWGVRKKDTFERDFELVDVEAVNNFRPYGSTNRCRFYNNKTDTIYIAHDEVVVEADEHPDYDPKWLGPTPNPYHYGYCARCGQPFKWRVPDLTQPLDPTFTGWVSSGDPLNAMGWVETTREQIHEEYVAWVEDARLRAVGTVHELEEARSKRASRPSS